MLSNIKQHYYLIIFQCLKLFTWQPYPSNWHWASLLKARQLISPALIFMKKCYNKNYYFLQRNHRPKNKKPIDSKCCQTKCCILLWVQGYPYGLLQSLPTQHILKKKNNKIATIAIATVTQPLYFSFLALCVICVRTKIFFSFSVEEPKL